MMRRKFALVEIIIIITLLLLFTWQHFAKKNQSNEKIPPPTQQPVPAAASTLPGDRILDSYAHPSGTAESDLTWMSRALDNFRVIHKNPAALPLGANEEIAAALLGRRRSAPEPFISATSKALNSSAQLIDRWGTPLYFHAESADRIDIRSAGPDQKMWTPDDIHRHHNGTFATKESLNAPSLYHKK